MSIPVDMVDSDVANYSLEDLMRYIFDSKPLYVCLIASGSNPSASTMTMVGIIDFCKKYYKDPESKNIPIVIWGGHPTALPERTLKETGADFVIKGEGYETLSGLYQSFINGKSKLSAVKGLCYLQDGRFVQNETASLIDVNSLPMVDWDRIKPSSYRAHNWHCFGDDIIEKRSPYAIIWTSMGCPHPCNFCCINNLFMKRTFRFRSIDSVIKEIDVLVNKHGVRHIKILDELFIIKHPRIQEFCEKLEERKYDLNLWCFARIDSVSPEILDRLKKVGMNWVAYGIESVDRTVLTSTAKRYTQDLVDNVVKWSRSAGINICADAIFGLWDDCMETMSATKEFLFENNFEWINIYPAYAYPGTPLYEEYIEKGFIKEPENWEHYSLYGYEGGALPTKHLSSAQVLKFRDDVFNEYFSRPAFLSMIENKFGTKTRDHALGMTKVRLKRRILGD
jgi:radical SAM superfamily enzyme YgiQ (UPF0313 family)